jgi:DNA-binding beta-propeller fold protein YncE
MKKIFLLSAIMLTLISMVNAQKLSRLWETDSVLRVPESVLYDANNKILYVANIDGKPDEKDGKGFISKVTPDGAVINLEWVTGLDAPKGMGLSGNTLYVADVTAVAIIDILKGKVINRIEVEGAKFLNDITVDDNGNVYISDSSTGKIHKLTAGNVSLYFESAADFKGPNGLLALKDGLYIADFPTGALFRLSWEKKLTKIGDTVAGGDGIIPLNRGEFIVSSWYGELHAISSGGKLTKLMDTKAQKSNSADLGYNAQAKVLYVPTFFKNTVIAYSVSK